MMRILRAALVFLVLFLLISPAFSQGLDAADKTFSDKKAADDAAKAADAACKAAAAKPKKAPGDWDLSTNFGFNLANGNSDNLLLTAGAQANRDIDDDSYNLGFNGAVGEQDGEDTQRYIRGDAGYKHLLDDRMYLGFSLAYLSDEIANVDYRLFINPALGYYLIRTDETKFNVEAGPSYIFEKLGPDKNDFLAARVAERLEWKFSETGKFFEGVEFLLNTSDTEDYLLNSEAGIEATLTSELALVFSIRDRYDNQPSANREKNDVFITTALKVAL